MAVCPPGALQAGPWPRTPLRGLARVSESCRGPTAAFTAVSASGQTLADDTRTVTRGRCGAWSVGGLRLDVEAKPPETLGLLSAGAEAFPTLIPMSSLKSSL